MELEAHRRTAEDLRTTLASEQDRLTTEIETYSAATDEARQYSKQLEDRVKVSAFVFKEKLLLMNGHRRSEHVATSMSKN